MRKNQRKAFEIIPHGAGIFQIPVGGGKTEIAIAFLRTLAKKGGSPLFYLTITKAQANQIKERYPEVKLVFGRNEYPCLYYKSKISAEEAPCSLLDCPHRVYLETGETKVPGVEPCPYLLAKYEAKKGGIVVCTFAFYLFVQLFHKEWGKPAGLVIEEAHKAARMVRACLRWSITDHHLRRNIEILKDIGAEEALILKKFLGKMMRIVKAKKDLGPTLLKDKEIRDLISILLDIDAKKLLDKVKEAVKKGLIDPDEEVETLKKLETIAHQIPRYIRSFEYSLPTPIRKPLSFTYGFYRKKLRPRQRIRYELGIRSWYVAPLIRKILPPYTIALSATIGDPEIFSYETGIDAPFHDFPSEFPVENTRIFLPTDTLSLAFRTRRKRDPQKALRTIAQNCKRLASMGLRSLVVVVSEWERKRFLYYCQRFEVDVVSYGNGKKPREVVEEFKEGKGEVLVGTVACYGEGIDLPKKLAPFIVFLRPAYPKWGEPATEFERKRYGKSMCWKLWNWRVMIEALQVRGRNIRNPEDLGATVFYDQRFRRFVYAALPGWLKDAYVGDLKLEEAMQEAIQLVK